MKKIYLILLLACVSLVSVAQETPEIEPSEKKQQNIEALKVAFITKELDLTSEEAKNFWPVYNEYEKEIHQAVKDNPNVIDRDEKILNVRKKYQGQFTKVLGSQQRMNRLFNAENKFRQLLIKVLQRQKMKRGLRNGRPGLRDQQ